MRSGNSRPTWQTVVLVVLFTVVVTGLLYTFRENTLVQFALVSAMSGGVILAGWRRGEYQNGRYARFWAGLFLFFSALYVILDVSIALWPAIALLLVSLSYSFREMVDEDPLGVHDRRDEQ